MEDASVTGIIDVINAAANQHELELLRVQFEQGVRVATTTARQLLQDHQRVAIMLRKLFIVKRKELRMK